jgi:hypothetical protein
MFIQQPFAYFSSTMPHTIEEGKVNHMYSNRHLLAGLLGAVSTIVGELITCLLVYLKFGQLDLYQFHSLFLTIDEPSIVLGSIISLLIGGCIGVYLYTCHEKHGTIGIIIRSFAISLLVWFFFETVFTIFYAGLLDLTRPINEHYVYLLGIAVSGITMGILLKTLIFKKTLPKP